MANRAMPPLRDVELTVTFWEWLSVVYFARPCSSFHSQGIDGLLGSVRRLIRPDRPIENTHLRPTLMAAYCSRQDGDVGSLMKDHRLKQHAYDAVTVLRSTAAMG